MSRQATRLKIDAEQLVNLPGHEALRRIASAINDRGEATANQLDSRLTVADNMLAAVKSIHARIPAMPWREVGATGQPAFENSWVNYNSATHETAGFAIDDSGWVRLKGLVKLGVAASIFTLPVGYRPSLFRHFAATANNADSVVSIDSAGSVKQNAGSTVWLSLDGMGFNATSPSAPDAFSGNGWPLLISSGLGVPVKGVTVWAALDETDASNKGSGAVGVSWVRGPDDAVSIRRMSGLTPGRTYTVTLVFWGG